MYQLAVVGNPIAHSLSPVIFNLFAKQCDIELNYQRILAHDEQDFKNKVADFFAANGTALNVTSPFKYVAYSSAKSQTARAKFCQASNFLYTAEDGVVTADTTDGIGLVMDLETNRGLDLEAQNILIIGSGYVVDSILLDIIYKNPRSIDVLARNTKRIDYFSNKFATGSFNQNKNYDIILNSTPNIPENTLFTQIRHILDTTFCYDLIYIEQKSLFLTTMAKLNSNIHGCNGLGMLIEQAKVAFTKLFNKLPDTQSVFKQLA